jgi:hypothetical protein
MIRLKLQTRDSQQWRAKMVVTLSALLLIVVVVGVIYFWTDFYVTGGVQIVKEDWYLKFEKAFLPADIWMSACALAGAIGLLTGQTYGLLFSLLAGSSMIFLALIDITFNIQNGFYRLVTTSSQMKLALFSNIAFLGLGIAVIVCLGPSLALV